MLTSMVADRVPERIAKLVFVDTGPLPDGMSMSQFGDPEEQAYAALVASDGDGWRLPRRAWKRLAEAVPDLDPEVVEILNDRAVPQPWATATAPVSLTGAWESLPRLGILCGFTEERARGMAPPCRRSSTGTTRSGVTRSCRPGTGRCSGEPDALVELMVTGSA